MDIIWAPWRQEYVEAPHNKDAQGKCIFCEFPSQNKDNENFIFLRRKSCFGILNRYPYNNGHLLIAPYAHVPELINLDNLIITDIMNAVRDCIEALKKIISPHGFNIGINLGTAAGAGIADHIHWHVVPRWHGDTNFMPVTGNTKVIPQSLQKMFEMLSSCLK